MYAHIFKTSEGAKKAWLSRSRAMHHTGEVNEKGHKGKGDWVPADGKPLTKIQQELLDKVAIPPNWDKVRIVKGVHEKGLIAKGWTLDKFGNPKEQYKYDPDQVDKNTVTKFARVAKLNLHMAALMSHAQSEMLNPALPQAKRDNAAGMYIVARTGFRPGGKVEDASADDQAYGASTLEKRHITISDNGVISFDFTGKSAVHNVKTVTDPAMAQYLRAKMDGLGPNDKVLKSTGSTLNRYMKKAIGNDEFKIKDVRTWNGTAVARSIVENESTPKNAAELKDQMKRVSEAVSKHLNNTPEVALLAYIDAKLWKHEGDMTDFVNPNLSKKKKLKEVA